MDASSGNWYSEKVFSFVYVDLLRFFEAICLIFHLLKFCFGLYTSLFPEKVNSIQF